MVEGRSIESLYDFMYDDTFQHLKPFFSNFESTASTRAESREGTIERSLYHRIIKGNGVMDMNTFEWGLESTLRATRLYGKPYNEGKIVFIEDMNIVINVMKHTGCHDAPETVRGTKISKDDILPGLRGQLVSFHTHNELFKLIHYIIQTMIEFDIPNGYFNYVKITKFPAFYRGLKGEGFECEEKLSNIHLEWIEG